mmetsp:Transcript_29853/g.65263  ORF Transcript_29853/g.65263 Transcript_29853/m.65263 type:complete len:245 (-) Transcript_29853:190-924(-)
MSKEDVGGQWGQPIPCRVGEVTHTRPKPPCRHFIDIRLDRRSRVQLLAFRNFYVAAITVKVKTYTDSDGVSQDWTPVLTDFMLMNDPHYEDDAQMDHVVNLVGLDPTLYVSKLRVYMMQPSPVWLSKNFHLQHLTCYACGDATLIHNQLARAGNQPVSEGTTLDNRDGRHVRYLQKGNVQTSAALNDTEIFGPKSSYFLACSQELKTTMRAYWERHEETRSTFVDKFTYENNNTDEETITVVGA